jgi:E3 ubiquitin-protein ligase SHPRH
MGRTSNHKRHVAVKHSKFKDINNALEPKNVSNLSQNDALLPDRLQITDTLIEYVSSTIPAKESPRKRQKLSSELHNSDTSSISSKNILKRTHIVVKQVSWEHAFVGMKLLGLKAALERKDIHAFTVCSYMGTPQYLRLTNDDGDILLHANVPSIDEAPDLDLALRVYLESKKLGQQHGKLWTEFGLSLSHKNGYDILRINLIIKWDVVVSPYHIPQASNKSRVLRDVIQRYFPDPNPSTVEDWSPQDFYQSVYVPDKTDKVSASIEAPNVEATLYPFQKRTIRWLLQREGSDWIDGGVRDTLWSNEDALSNSFIQKSDVLRQPCFVSSLFGLATLDIRPYRAIERHLKGGILAEEMGLGKTVEIIALVTLHPRPNEGLSQVYDQFTDKNVRPTNATLIISPPSILQQWISEINKHAPQLKVKHYQGIKKLKNQDFGALVDELADSDIVVTTYQVLTSEIHFTPLNPEKELRRESKYPRPNSPLMMLSWWRCIIDEAQMIESGVSNAAQVARMIPRINAWCVSGTPVRGNVRDLLGLLVFLRYEPFASIKHIWQSLTTTHKTAFRTLFGSIALRHSKQGVRDELRLPAQRRYVITMPFSPVEEQHYQEQFKQMCAELHVDHYGAPLDGWEELGSQALAERMRHWLVHLRQESLNPGVLVRKRRDGQRDGPLRTVDEVLDAMMENADLIIREQQRALLISKLTRGQLFENSPRVREAFHIWTETRTEASVVVKECREQLKLEVEKTAKDKMSSGGDGHCSSLPDDVSGDVEEEEE